MKTQPVQAALPARMTTFFYTKTVVMRASVECRIRLDRINKKGKAPVYLQVIINSEPTQIPLHVSWPVAHFDNVSGKFLPRSREDQEATDYNLHVTKEKAKVNDIFMYYRHSDLDLTITQFKREYAGYNSKKDFITWTEQQIEARYAENKCEKQTWKNGKSNLNVIRAFKPVIAFRELDEDFMERLDGWIRKKEYSVNSLSTILRMVQTYGRRASKAGIAVNLKSLNEFTPPAFVSSLVYLKEKELKRLEAYYNSPDIPATHRQVLAQFLFSCCTGLRFSDIQRVTWKNIHDDLLVWTPYKGRKKGRVVRVPLIERAYGYIQNTKGKLFKTLTEQATNRVLKEIATAAGVRKNLTTHVARHTFATQFLRKGGHLEVLQKLLGHKHIATTMIYVHVDTDRMREEMKVFLSDSFFPGY